MQYFQSRLETLSRIAIECGFDGLAGYLILARHTTGKQILGYPPHTLSGAGVNSIHEKLGCSEARASSILDRLVGGGFIERAPEDAKAAAPRSARWNLPAQYPLDIELPHAFVDPPKIAPTAVTSPLKRLKKLKAAEGFAASTANCDALMLLIFIYSSLKMSSYGGLSPKRALYRKWKSLKITEADLEGCFVWTVEPENESAYKSFMHAAMPHIKDKESSSPRFWQAFENLQEVGLIYEAVSLFTEEDELVVPIRVNDFHAGSVSDDRIGDPSLMKMMERYYGTRFAFYDPGSETLKVTLPFSTGTIYGIYRPRIRPATKDVGIWAKEDLERVNEVFALLSAKVTDDYDDDF